MILRTWRLDYQQSISIDHKHYIYFNHYANLCGKRSRFPISSHDFLNLNDIILNWENYGDIGNLPIGEHVWLSRRWLVKRLYHSETRNFFSFSKDSWLKYKKDIHYAVLHFLRDGRQLQNREHDANNKTSKRNQSQKSTRCLSQIQIPPWSSGDGLNSTKKRTKHSSLSKWNDSTLRCHFKFRCAVDEMRARKQAATDIESGEIANNANDNNTGLEDIEYCSID